MSRAAGGGVHGMSAYPRLSRIVIVFREFNGRAQSTVTLFRLARRPIIRRSIIEYTRWRLVAGVRSCTRVPVCASGQTQAASEEHQRRSMGRWCD